MMRISKWLLFTLLFCGCAQRNISEKSKDNLYKTNDTSIDAEFLLQHLNDSISVLHYKISNRDFIYKKYDTTSFYQAELNLNYCLTLSPDSKQIIDSATMKIFHRLENLRSVLISGKMELKIPKSFKGTLLLKLQESGSQKNSMVQFSIDNSSKFTAQNFIFMDSVFNPIFSGRFVKGSTVFFRNERLSQPMARVKLYKKNLMLPPPPFSERSAPFPDEPFDSLFYLHATLEGDYQMKINSSGIYFIELDTLHNEGCTVHGVDFDFPSVTSHEQMIACTRFILNNEEYERLTSAKDKQAAIEDFWISIGGNKERARQLIRRYYGRVKDANRYFSSFQDGWRTDRGMIFIVYGPPDKVYVSNNLETWTYGRDGTPQALVFRFNKRVNRFSENDFVLERSPQLKADWFMAVMNWREGRVISD